jgi:hypothetical protein
MKQLFLSFLFITILAFAGKASDSLEVYVGKYTFPAGTVVSEIDVVLENGQLKANSSQGNSTLVKTDVEDSFTIPEFSGTAVFKRDENKKIIGVRIEVMSMVLEGKKEEKEDPKK